MYNFSSLSNSHFHHPASRGFSLAWLYEVVCVACLLHRFVYAQTSHANDVAKAKSHAREKPLLAG